jgi:hypothetical protein
MSEEQAAHLVQNLMRNGQMSEEEKHALRVLTSARSRDQPPSPASSRGSGSRSTDSLSETSLSRRIPLEAATTSTTPSTFSPFSAQADVHEEIMRRSSAIAQSHTSGPSTSFAQTDYYPGDLVWRPSKNDGGITRSAITPPRPSFNRTLSHGAEDDVLPEDASIQDLNGTLASLDLDGSSNSINKYLSARP